jgi:predicted nucleic acid-binding protein
MYIPNRVENHVRVMRSFCLENIMGFLLDTSAVNRICDGVLATWWPVYITDLVLLELSRTPDAVRRHDLLAVLLGRLGPGGILRSDPADAHHTAIDDFDIPFEGSPALSLGRPFPLITRAIGSNFRRHWEDGFIAQTAMRHGLTLVTADKRQAKAARMFGVTVECIN